MSVERIWRWECDTCGVLVYYEDPGLPPGWIFRRALVLTNHCADCKSQFPAREHGLPKITAERQLLP